MVTNVLEKPGKAWTRQKTYKRLSVMGRTDVGMPATRNADKSTPPPIPPEAQQAACTAGTRQWL